MASPCRSRQLLRAGGAQRQGSCRLFSEFTTVVVSGRPLKLQQERRVIPLSRRPDIEQMLDARTKRVQRLWGAIFRFPPGGHKPLLEIGNRHPFVLESLPKCPRSRSSKWESIVKISVVEMRRRFNKTDFAQLASDLEYRYCVVDINSGIQLETEPPGELVTGLMMGLLDREDRLVAKMHGYLRDDGTLGGRGYLDPTLLVVDGVCMRMLPKPPPDSRT